MKSGLSMYRVYGMSDDGQVYDDYCQASTAQIAVDRIREWRSEDVEKYRVIEVSKVLKSGWR